MHEATVGHLAVRTTRRHRSGAGSPLALAISPRHTDDMTAKQQAIEAIQELPDNCSLDEIADRLEFLAAIQKGLEQLETGKGIPHEEIKKQLASWLIRSPGLPCHETT